MPDYNIYIHTLGGTGGNGSNTVPQEDEIPNFQFDPRQAVSVARSFSTSGFSNFVSTGVSALSKVFPAAAIAVAVAKTTEHILTTGFSHLEDYTGNYQYAMQMNNAMTALQNIINPVSWAKNQIHRQAQFDKQNKRLEQERFLIGNSQLSNSKVGV